MGSCSLNGMFSKYCMGALLFAIPLPLSPLDMQRLVLHNGTSKELLPQLISFILPFFGARQHKSRLSGIVVDGATMEGLHETEQHSCGLCFNHLR